MSTILKALRQLEDEQQRPAPGAADALRSSLPPSRVRGGGRSVAALALGIALGAAGVALIAVALFPLFAGKAPPPAPDSAGLVAAPPAPRPGAERPAPAPVLPDSAPRTVVAGAADRPEAVAEVEGREPAAAQALSSAGVAARTAGPAVAGEGAAVVAGAAAAVDVAALPAARVASVPVPKTAQDVPESVQAPPGAAPVRLPEARTAAQAGPPGAGGADAGRSPSAGGAAARAPSDGSSAALDDSEVRRPAGRVPKAEPVEAVPVDGAGPVAARQSPRAVVEPAAGPVALAGTTPPQTAASTPAPASQRAIEAPHEAATAAAAPRAEPEPHLRLRRTTWHPLRERREALVRGEDGRTRQVREGDDIEGFEVVEITPSSVVLSRAGERRTLRLGERSAAGR